MLTTLSNKYSTEYTSQERGTNLFITFLYVLFFFQFFRNAVLGKQVDKYIVLTQTILVLIWYGLSIIIT